MKIIFDLDHTLLDTKRLRDDLVAAYAKLGVAPERFQETYRQMAASGYDPQEQLTMLSSDLPDAEAARRASHLIDIILDRSPEYVYDGVRDLLAALRSRGDSLFLLTRGRPAWQETKLKKSGLASFFHVVEVTDGPKAEILPRLVGDEPATVVDDDLKELSEMMAACPQTRFIAVRPSAACPSGLNCEEAHDLNELTEMLLG